jgi:hypothetical protein
VRILWSIVLILVLSGGVAAGSTLGAGSPAAPTAVRVVARD